jgi:hypothetical protein
VTGVLEADDGRLVGIEVKAAETVQRTLVHSVEIAAQTPCVREVVAPNLKSR